MNDEVENNLPLVTYILKTYYKHFDDDLFQIGCIGLIKGIKTYNANENIKKSTYYSKCIYNEIGSALRKTNTIKTGKDFKIISIDNTIDSDKSNNFNRIEYKDLYIDKKVNILDDLVNKENIKKLIHCVKRLPKKDKFVIVYTFGLFNEERKTQEEMSKELGITQASISRILKRSLIKLKGMMKDEE